MFREYGEAKSPAIGGGSALKKARALAAQPDASLGNADVSRDQAEAAQARTGPQAPPIVRELAERVPYSHFGDDRLLFICEQVDRLAARDRTSMRLFYENLIRYMLTVGASDIDLGGPAAKGQIWLRINGEKRPDEKLGTFSVADLDVIILNLLNESHRKSLLEGRAVDFSYQLASNSESGDRSRFRATAYFDMEHLALNMRAITDELRPLKALEFHPLVARGLMFRHVRDGLTLITGVTGSGKSTTMDAIIDANNQDSNAHIVIIGKPIEYMHKSQRCIVRHREVGRDVNSFKDGIVQSLRQDPDIVVIGEMRDPETISSALEITDSGHKVFSTLHTSSAVESIDRIIAEYPTDEQNRVRNRLADVLRCIVSQKLVPQVGGGRVMAKEVLWITPSSRAAIKNENASEIYQMMWEGWSQGQITLEQDLHRLVRKGRITPDTAMNYANNKRRLKQLL